MTTGRINQVTTQRGARGAAPRPTEGPPARWRTGGPTLYRRRRHRKLPCKPSKRKPRPWRQLVDGCSTLPTAGAVDDRASTKQKQKNPTLSLAGNGATSLTELAGPPPTTADSRTDTVRTPAATGGATAATRRNGDGTCGEGSWGAQQHPDSTNGTQLSEPELELS